jgi:hypothetical protein
MNRNKIFSPKRFCLLVYNDLLIHYRAYALYVAGFGILLYLIFWGIMASAHHFGEADYVPFMIFPCIVVLAIAGSAFPNLSNKITTANYILLPASALEKYLSQFFIRCVLTTAVFIAIFLIDVDLAKDAASTPERIMRGQNVISEFDFDYIMRHVGKLRDKIAIYCAVFSLMSLFFAARLFFTKYAALKTLLAGIILGFGFCFFLSLFSIFGHNSDWFPVKLRSYEICERFYNVQLYFYCIAYVSWIFFLSIGYFKFKEKQI